MRNEIWVVCETADGGLHQVSKELLGEARVLADSCQAETAAVIFEDACADAAIALGADIVYLFEGGDSPPSEHACASGLARLAQDDPPLVILLGSTIFGRSVAPQAAAVLATGLTADCTGLAMENNHLLVQCRPAYTGHIFAEVVGTGSLPQMATVRRGVMREPAPDAKRAGRVVRVGGGLPANPFIVLSRTEHGGNAQLIDAPVIVAGGLGAGRKGFELLRRLADKTGCRVGATRAAVNAGLAPYSEQIGQTGITVRPKVYIACGISGSVQHLAGMSSAEYIVAVNTDRQAPIFDHADFGYVGDSREFLEQMLNNGIRCFSDMAL